MHEALVCFAWIWTSGFQTNGGGKAELCSLWECLMLGATRSQGGGGSRINLASPKAMPCPPSSQFDKYQKSTRNENASNFLCCQSPFVCSVHFAGFSPAFVPQSLSRWMASGTYAPPPLSIGIGLGFVGSSHVMLLTATTTQLPLWQTRI